MVKLRSFPALPSARRARRSATGSGSGYESVMQVLRRGRHALPPGGVAVLPQGEYQDLLETVRSLRETVDVLSEPGAREEIEASQADYRDGRTASREDFLEALRDRVGPPPGP